MGSEAETDTNTSVIPTLPLFSFPPLKSSQHSANLNSPLHTSASVPFRWEEHPGKPLPCLALALPSTNNTIKSLELPPRLLNEAKFTTTTSPTTVLEGPYNNSSAVGKSFSFRFLRKRHGSFDGTLSLGGSRGSSPERGLLGTIVLSHSSSTRRRDNKGLFGSWRKRGGHNKNFKGKSDVVHGGNFVFPSFLSDDGTGTTSCEGGGATVKVTKMSRNSSFLGMSPAKSHFWATIYGAFKHVLPSPRKSTKWKKDAW